MRHRLRGGIVPPVSPLHRGVIAALAVGLWMALGWGLRLDPNASLLLGVPLTLAFQRWVARRPLAALWVRERAGPTPARVVLVLAPLLALAPAWDLVRMLRATPRDPVVVGWTTCALLGAVAAAFALSHFRRETFAAFARWVAIAFAIGAALMVLAWRARGMPPAAGVGSSLHWLLLYFPIAFVLEEVFFRGALDAFMHRPGEAHGGAAAVFVSALWGLWHLPLAPDRGVAPALGLMVVHVLMGVPLSIGWRRSGNLAVPAAAHALVDAVRNALLR